MAHKGKRFLAVLLSLAAAPAQVVFSQTRGAAAEGAALHAELAVPSLSGAPALAPSLDVAPALSAAPASAVLSAPIPAASALMPAAPSAAPTPAMAPARPVAAAAIAPSAGPAVMPAFVSARGAFAAPADGPGKPATGESAKASADASFDGSIAKPGSDAVQGRESAGAPALRPAGSPAGVHPAPSIFDPGPRTASFPDRIRDQLRYTKLMTRSFWWYMFTHIGDPADPKMWPGHKARWKKASAEGPVAVSRPRSFFTAMRVTGMSGRFYALGGSALEDDLVIQEFRGAFDEYFDGPGVGPREREAFERFMRRARHFNAEKRAHTNMYKNIRDPLLKASTMRPEQLAPYFDSLLPSSQAQAIKDFQQSGKMDTIREAFMATLTRTLGEEDPNDPHRVRAAIVLGSFATGSAGPGSDFDVEALVNGASNERLPAFSKRLVARWTEAGWHKTNPVTVHDNASWPSWGLVNIVQTRHYVVVSNEASLVARLSRQAFENPAVTLERGYTVRGAVNRVFQRGLVLAATLVSDVKAALGIRS